MAFKVFLFSSFRLRLLHLHIPIIASFRISLFFYLVLVSEPSEGQFLNISDDLRDPHDFLITFKVATKQAQSSYKASSKLLVETDGQEHESHGNV